MYVYILYPISHIHHNFTRWTYKNKTKQARARVSPPLPYVFTTQILYSTKRPFSLFLPLADTHAG